MSRPLRWITGIILLFLVTLAGAAAFLASTEAGLHWAYRILAGRLPGKISVQSLHGRLIGPISVTGLDYRTDDLAVTVSKGYLDWLPYFLTSGEIAVTKLDAEGISVESRKKKAPLKSFPEIRLPLVILVREASIRDLRIIRPAAPPVAVQGISFEMSTGWGNVYIHKLDLQAQGASIRLKGRVRPRGDYPLSLKTDWSVKPEQYPHIRGKGEISGTVLRRLLVKQELREPFKAAVGAEIYDVLANARGKADLRVERLVPRDINRKWPAVGIAGEARLSYSADVWNIEDLVITMPGNPARIEMKGVYTGAGEKKTLSLHGRWKDLSWPLRAPALNSAEGAFDVRGSPDAYVLKADLALAGKNIPPGRWSVSGSGDLTSLTIYNFSSGIFGGELRGSGKVRWKPLIEWKVALTGMELNPGAVWPKWPGRLGVQADTAGRYGKEGIRGSVDIRRAGGTLRGYPFRAVMHLLVDGDRYTLSGMEVDSGSAHMSASGGLLNPWSVRWKISAPNLEALVPDSRGALYGSGAVSGPRSAPFITASLKGSRLVYKEYRAESLSAISELDMQDRKSSRIDLRAAGVKANGRVIDALSFQGTGRTFDHKLALMIRTRGEVFDAEMNGRYREKLWQGMLRQSSLASPEFGKWTLERAGPFVVNIAGKNIDAGQWCWTNADSRFCVFASWRGEAGSRGTVLAERIPLGLLRPFLPPDAGIAGTLSGNADVKYAQGDLYGKITLRAARGSMSYLLTEKERATLAYREILFDATLRNRALTARLNAPLEDGGAINGALTIADFSPFQLPKEKQRIQGNLHAEVNRLGIIQALVPDAENIKGVFRADLTLGGTLAEPLFGGTAALEDGSAYVPRFGINVREVRFAISGRPGSETATLEGELKSGPGTITLQGEAGLNPKEGWPLSISLKGRNFEAAGIPVLRLYISPDIGIRVKGRRIDVDGEVAVPRAAFTPRDLSRAVRVSEDVVIVDRVKEHERKETWMIYSRVKITLGDEVFFNGYGLTGRVKGSIVAREEPQQITVATGDLEVVDGKYNVYGQSLDVERARLVFAGGPIDNPSLDARVVRKADKTEDVTAGISIQGSLKKPRMTLFSSPAMEQTEILSYLILGTPMQSATGEQGQQLYSAARSLSLSGGEFIARRIGSVFGIRDIHVERGAKFEETSVVLGTYLSPRLYVGYGIGLFEPISRVRLRYDISKKFQVQVESGTQSGADLFYKIER